MESINVYPVLVTWKESKKTGLCPIHLSVDINGKRFAFPSLNIKVAEANWDNESKQIKKKVPNYALLNGKISKRANDISAELMKKQLAGKTLNRDMVKKLVKGGKSGLDFYYYCLGDETKEKKDGQIYLQQYEESTIATYKSEITKLKQYRASLSFGDIDYNFLNGYKNYMITELKNSPNTIWKSFKFIHSMIELAIEKTKDFVGENPFSEFDRGQYVQGIPEYLEWPELQKVHEKLANEDIADDIKLTGYHFLLSSYSGLRFGDSMNFRYEKDVIETGTGLRLVLYATKNDGIVSMAFNKYIAEVVEYIKDKPHPIVTNQEFNRRLKLIGLFAGIKKPLKSHMARHTFGMRCAEIGVTIESTQRLMGHKERSSTLIYYRVKDNRSDRELKEWENE